MSTTSMWDYTFSVWPDETQDFDRAIFAVFLLMQNRVTMSFTPGQFEAFRSALSYHGLTLREVERVPHHVPEAVP